ncbi:MAG TPA: RNA polymerase sigma factor [Polyangia bacterium]
MIVGDVRRAAARLDVHSFQSIYDTYYTEVARWIRALGGPAADQDDLIQEVFVVVYRRLPDFDGRNLAGWLYRIAAHQVRDYRRLVWIKHIFRRSVALSSEVPSARPTPIMTLETRERQRSLERLLSRLSDPLRAAFVLFEIEGYTAEEISEMQSVPTNTVRARIHRARKKMTALLESGAAAGAVAETAMAAAGKK